MFSNIKINSLDKNIAKVHSHIDDIKLYSYYEKEFKGFDEKGVEERLFNYEKQLSATDATFISYTEPEICLDKSYKVKISYALYAVPKSLKYKEEYLESRIEKYELAKAKLLEKIKK